MIWVVATSKHGSTGEVAEAVAEELRRAGHDVERKDAEQVHGLDRADVVVLGSPIYGGAGSRRDGSCCRIRRRRYPPGRSGCLASVRSATRPSPTSPSRRNSSRAQRRSGRVSTACSAGGWTAPSSGAASD